MSKYKNKELFTSTKNFEKNEFAISIKGLSKEEKLLKAKEYRLENFDFDSEEEILYSSNNTKEESKKVANYKCELNNEHITFTSKSTDNPYVEAHHLIPFSKRNKFDINIDILENLVALCPNCHRKIHLSKDDEKIELLELLYERRKKQLHNELIEIDKEQLFSFYNIKDK
ncbi:MAG: HNH endonuclease signature motif containing protein [Campylobacterota bacterium]|nr:HNH endonuclease signature motif containing protein [Campylobacterota bacterium]